MFTVRNHRTRIASVTLASMTMIIGMALPAEASGPNQSASSVINSTKAALAKESGVHVLLTSTTSSLSTKVVADIGATAGMETITEGSDQVTIKVTPAYAYLSGNAAGLTKIMGLSTTQQKRVGNGTISMKVGTSPYKSLKSSVTMPVLANILPVVVGTGLSTVSVGGQQYYELKWSTKATTSTSQSKSLMTLSEGTTVLPLRETVNSTSGTSTTTFSRWGENVNVSAPPASGTIPYSKVFG